MRGVGGLQGRHSKNTRVELIALQCRAGSAACPALCDELVAARFHTICAAGNPALLCTPPAGRRSLLLHLPRLEDGRLLLASSGPLDPTVPCEGFTEVPPGIYSISFGQAEQGGRLVGVHSAHPWTDPWVQWLAQFKRPAELMAPAGVTQHSGGSSSSGSDGSAAAAGGAAGGRTAPGPPHTAAAAAGMAGAGAIALAPSQQGVDTHSPAQQGQHIDVLPSIPFNMSPLSMALPGEVSTLESAVARMLAALRASMAVRCQCIEEHAVHTAHTAQAAPSCPPIFSSSSQPPPAAAAGRGASTPGACPPTSAECSAAASGLMPTSPAERPAGVTSACSPVLPPAPVLILFSGGLDSTLMAALVHEALPPGEELQHCVQGHQQSRRSGTGAGGDGRRKVGGAPAGAGAVAGAGGENSLAGGRKNVENVGQFGPAPDLMRVHAAAPQLTPGVPIDLSSICFAGGESPDRRAALDALAELQQLAPERQWRLIQVGGLAWKAQVHKVWGPGLCATKLRVASLKLEGVAGQPACGRPALHLSKHSSTPLA